MSEERLAHIFDLIEGSGGEKTPKDELLTIINYSGPWSGPAQRVLKYVENLEFENAKLKTELAFAQDALTATREELK